MQNFDDIPLLRVENLCVKYGIGGGIFSRAKKTFNAVDDISFEVKKGEILGLVGESGSGKTTTGRAIIRLAPISGGEIFYGGKKISALSNSEFMLLLDQGTMDKEAVEDLFDISSEQLACVNGAEPGMGLIRFGDKIVPFDNTMEKDSSLYQLFNTNFHEMVNKKISGK